MLDIYNIYLNPYSFIDPPLHSALYKCYNSYYVTIVFYVLCQ